MKRTQIYLPIEMHQKLAHEAKKRRTTVSEIVRFHISRGIQFGTNQRWTKADLFRDLDNVTNGLKWSKMPKNLSEKIDETLYG